MKQQQYQQVQYQYTLYKALKNKGDSNKYVIRQKIYSTFTVGVHFSNMNMIQQIMHQSEYYDPSPLWVKV